jgi:hypothetical protein
VPTTTTLCRVAPTPGSAPETVSARGMVTA